MSDAPRYYEDLEPGWEQSAGSYRVEREEIISFAERWDPQPWHLDDAAAAETVFGGLCACASHTMAIQSRLTHELPERMATVAGLGNEGMQLQAPVRPGDRLTLHVKVVSKRISASWPEHGIVGLRWTLENQKGEAVLTTLGNVMVERRPGEASGK